MIASQIADFIQRYDSFLLSCHINADGDAIGSTLALAQAMDQLGKQYRIILHDELPDPRFRFLEHYDDIEWSENVDSVDVDAAIICDTPTTERLGDPTRLLPSKDRCVKIDHHPDEETFTGLSWVDVKASSTTCLIYQIFEHLPIKYDVMLAQTILSGLMYDTGRFSYRNTKSIDLRIAAEMVDYGANIEKSYNHIFAENSLSALQTIGNGLASLETFFDNQVGMIYLDVEDSNRNPSGEIEDLTNYTTSATGVHVGLFVRQQKPGFFKVSLRSRGLVNVNEVAAEFGGGGHKKASGCRITADSFETVRAQLLNSIGKYLKKLNYID